MNERKRQDSNITPRQSIYQNRPRARNNYNKQTQRPET